MRRFRDFPIRLKLTGVILLVSSLVLLAAALALIGYEASIARERLATDLHGLAELIGVNSRATLEFQDAEAAAENLTALSARAHITSGAVYDRDGWLFAAYRKTAEAPIPPRARPPGARYVNGYLELSHKIGPWNAPVGTVYLRADLAQLDELIRHYTLIVASLFGVLLLATLGLAAVLQRGISQPIVNLTRIARAVTQRRDYSLRARKQGEDEIGLLTDALNQMLTEIETQNAALASAYRQLETRNDELSAEVRERQRAEEEVRALNAELEQRVSARTAELQAVNQELEGFSYSVSHDLRAPLRGIDGFIRIIQNEYGPQLDDEAHRLIGIVRANCRSMGQLIDDLLAFSRLGRKQVSKSRVDMNALVAGVLDDIRAMPDETLPAVTVEDLPTALCDAALMRQVWFNLISNAAKFSVREDQPRIRIWAAREPTRTVFAVSDNGVGFDMKYYDKLFGVFQRLHLSDEFPGTGVGLATIKRIVTRHGGQVWAEGKLEEGATFYFALPHRRAR